MGNASSIRKYILPNERLIWMKTTVPPPYNLNNVDIIEEWFDIDNKLQILDFDHLKSTTTSYHNHWGVSQKILIKKGIKQRLLSKQRQVSATKANREYAIPTEYQGNEVYINQFWFTSNHNYYSTRTIQNILNCSTAPFLKISLFLYLFFLQKVDGYYSSI